MHPNMATACILDPNMIRYYPRFEQVLVIGRLVIGRGIDEFGTRSSHSLLKLYVAVYVTNMTE
jgi:hypothetical protein